MIAGAGLGLVIGVLLGLLGGGSILAVPALVYGAGVFGAAGAAAAFAGAAVNRDERYARGELSTEEYRERLRILGEDE